MDYSEDTTELKPIGGGIWRPAFLRVFAEVGNVTEAAKAAGVDRTTVWRHKSRDSIFAAQFAEAEQQAADVLEREAWRRATEGIDEPQFYKGEQCGVVKRYSDNLLMFLLRGSRPEKFRERFVLPSAELDKLIEHELAQARGETELPDDAPESVN